MLLRSRDGHLCESHTIIGDEWVFYDLLSKMCAPHINVIMNI